MVSSARLCLICKGGRALCGNSPCPLLPRFRIEPRMRKVSKEFFGPSYSIFIGRQGYPNVNIGPLAAIEERPDMDKPSAWFGRDYSDIIELHSLLLRSKQRESVKSRSRLVQESQELVLASKPTDVEMSFKKKPVYRVSFSDVVQPMGPSAPLEKLRVAENPNISRRVDKIVSDELKANHASFQLYESGLDVYKISSILSSGVLGLKENKKLVPTRWGITGTDDIVAKELMRQVRNYRSVESFMVFESGYLDNHFVVLFMPGSWEFEYFEAWAPGSMWSQNLKKTEILEDYEPFRGRTNYADLEGGGYYASRIACVEKLKEMKRQARVVVFREIYEGYVIPLGVWVVRETARSAYKNRPIFFSTKEEALKHIDSKLRLPVKEYLKRSKILRQKRLVDF
jgi:hypothetical protein